MAGTKRVGHLGTLDPLATGLLLLVTGNATRLATYFGGCTKTYQAQITLGLQSTTYDIEGEITARHDSAIVQNAGAVDRVLDNFRGTFLQKPPAVSAKKISGVPAYKLVRQNRSVDLPPAEVTVHHLSLDTFAPPVLTLTIRCSAGTYIRSIAHDLGQSLGCGAVLSGLRRTHVDQFSVADSFSLERLGSLAQKGALATAIIPTSRMLLDIPSVHVDELVEQQIRHGRIFRSSPFVVEPGAPMVRAISHQGDLVALGELVLPNVYQPKVVL